MALSEIPVRGWTVSVRIAVVTDTVAVMEYQYHDVDIPGTRFDRLHVRIQGVNTGWSWSHGLVEKRLGSI